MSITKHTVSVVSAGLALTAASLLSASPATSAEPAGTPWFCSQHPLDTSRLPHTADAIAGWFASCPTGSRTSAAPRTADGAQQWLATQQ